MVNCSILQYRKYQLISGILAELGQPGSQKPSFKQLTSALAAIVSSSGSLPSMVLREELESRGLLLVTNLRGALTNLQSYQGAAFQLACYQGAYSFLFPFQDHCS